MTVEEIQHQTKKWVEQFVIGLGLCPFASAPMRAGLVHINVSEATTLEALVADLVREVEQLVARSRGERETTLLVTPFVLEDFEEFLDFLSEMEALWEEANLDGVLQLVSFHPDYRFAGAPDNDPANATNRSPFPMLHLLREDSVTEVLETHPDPDGIPERNVRLLRRMGDDGIRQVMT
ncbi:MAG: DUF1415 domain-containing protein [Bacteroidia bacterium]|nr:DUF1415 domain-containing protein [Bacteroidia bacterium]